MDGPVTKKKYRSQEWFDNPDNPGMTALYLERYLNFGLTREELQSGKPLIGIAQTGSDLSPCNRHHLELAKRIRAGIEAAGGIVISQASEAGTPGLGIHAMGTARMGADPRESVLNAHNQAHDVPNLFITDGSFMTSASCVNPSLTYMAFTARACDYAVKQLAEGVL